MIDDSGDIAVVHVATWRATYRGLMPQSLLDGLSVEARTAVWRRILRDDEGSTLVAIEQGAERVVGFVSVGPSRDTDPDRIDGRLDGLRCRVIDPAAQVEIKQTLPVWIQEGRDVSRMRSM